MVRLTGVDEMDLLAKNANGDTFQIYRSRGEWYAEQVTGCERNYGNIGALLHDVSYQQLVSDLKRHWSN